ncbi:TPA: type VI secretion protein VasK [Citrobacter braakii]|uniref:ImcF-related family protein n=1 Tax=Citrobacter braakii TaxID=57706 RepID=UPI0015EAC94D|nr:type VI secretion protein VasK [Citrobacter sp. RHBSTW-01044]HEE9993721.1 type VI secretion protein VasK [Citrobacter braakii]HEF0004503.1 type VI secretion protein VasK [Citrobacter braakii]HEF0035130.1 type VI secretion protein VasK [Citrobacter braakii]
MQKSSLLRLCGLLFILVVVGLICYVVLYYYGGYFGVTTPTTRVIVITSILLALCYIFKIWQVNALKSVLGAYVPLLKYKAIAYFLLPWKSAYESNVENHTAATLDSNIFINFYSTLKDNYGRRWRAKTRILLVMGDAPQVDQLVPELTSQRWVEGDGVVLIWGGKLTATPDVSLFDTIRKLHRRPLDGVVWVTHTYQQHDALLQSAPVVPLTSQQMDEAARHLLAVFTTLRWRVPLYLWSLHGAQFVPDNVTLHSATCMLPSKCTTALCRSQLTSLAMQMAEQGTQQVTRNLRDNFLLKMANLLMPNAEAISDLLSTFFSPHRPLPLAAVILSQYAESTPSRVAHAWTRDERWRALLDSLPALPAELKAQRTGRSGIRVLAVGTAGLMLLWGAGMAVSFLANRNMITESLDQARLAGGPDKPLAERLTALSALQQTPGMLRWRQQNGVPWYYRFGLSQNDALLDALWPRYTRIAIPLLRDEAAQHLTQELTALTRLAPDSPQFAARAKIAYNQLKMYLMLSRPEQMEASFFSQALMQDWPERAGISRASWQGVGPGLWQFWGENLQAHPEWKIAADKNLISQVRTLLIRQMGIRNGEAALYQKIIEQVTPHYTDLRLEDMTGDTRADQVFYTRSSVAGVYTRQAWEEEVLPAIEKIVSNRREEMDQVLGDETHSASDPLSPQALKARLSERFFIDFADNWLDFLNSIRWKRTQTLSDAIDQLTLIADIRQSPLVALMNTLAVQGRTGLTGEALSDSLVKSAKDLFNTKEKQTIDQHAREEGPMASTFSPILALMDEQSAGQDISHLSLQTYLTRVTQVRLKLQQITNAADPQGMSQALAQTVFQGKTVDLTTTRDYGNLVAASLGQAWSGFGQTMFVQPLEQSWQQVLQPTAAGLNAQWKALIVNDWNSAFGGRYPFRDVGSEASLPLLAQYLRSDNGRIQHFLESHLSGVLHKQGSHWVADTVNAQGLVFNPAFLEAMDLLSQIADVAFIRGEAGIRFELRPGTARDVMQTDLVLDGQKLTYVNQMPTWKNVVWPADTQASGATLSWVSTSTGTRIYSDNPGTWGWIRLLEKAEITDNAGVSSGFNLRWTAQDGLPLNYTLRTEAGEGPLALLKLRDFELPEAIFIVSSKLSSEEEE